MNPVYSPSPLTSHSLSSSVQYYVTAAVGLSQLVSQCKLPLPDCVFLLGHLTRVLAEVREGSTDSGEPSLTHLAHWRNTGFFIVALIDLCTFRRPGTIGLHN